MHKQPEPLPVQGASFPPCLQGPTPCEFMFSRAKVCISSLVSVFAGAYTLFNPMCICFSKDLHLGPTNCEFVFNFQEPSLREFVFVIAFARACTLAEDRGRPYQVAWAPSSAPSQSEGCPLTSL